MTINCSDFFKFTGAHCHQIDGNSLLVSTPLNFPDASPVNLIVCESNGKFIISDDGDTLMRLHGLGLTGNTRIANSLRKRAMQCNGDLKNGELVFESKDLRQAYENFLRSMIDIINYELEVTAIEEAIDLAIDVVVSAIERRNQNVKFDYDVNVKGSTGLFHRFPLKAGNRLIDFTLPHSRSTGSILRKVADIEKAGGMAPLVIVDDTEKYEVAKREASLIGTFVPSILLSTLKAENYPIDLYGNMH